MPDRFLPVRRERLYGVVCGYGCVMIAAHHRRTVLPHEVDTPGGIGIVSDDVTQTVDGVDLGVLDGLKGPFEGFQVGVNIRKNGKAHRMYGTFERK